MEKKFLFKDRSLGEVLKVNVYVDEWAPNPLEAYFDEESEMGVVINTREFSYSSIRGVMTIEELSKFFKARNSGEELDDEASLSDCCKAAGYVCLPIWGYSHSGLMFRASERNPFEKWDSGLAGVAWINKNSSNGAFDFFNRIIDKLNIWLSGEVYTAEMHPIDKPEATMYVDYIYSLCPEDIKARIEDEYGLKGELVKYPDGFISNDEVVSKVRELLAHDDHEFVDPIIWQQLLNIVAREEELR